MHSKAPNGFILLEVLVAMSLILGVWMSSVGAYQGLALRLLQQESKRVKLRIEMDTYERLEKLRTNSHGNTDKGLGKHPNSSRTVSK